MKDAQEVRPGKRRSFCIPFIRAPRMALTQEVIMTT